MKSLFALLLVLAAAPCAAADAYKWVDEKGVVNYGEKPPQTRPAQPVNTNPGAIMEGGSQFSQKAEAGNPRLEEPQRPGRPQLVQAPPVGDSARGMDFDVFIRLQRDMTEGELLLRAGRPDHQGVENLYGDIVKSYYYFPTLANPYTTVVTLRAGRIANLERIRKF